MSTISLQQLIQAIKEEKLNKEQLEQYSDQLVLLFAEMQEELATLEKQEALFMAKDIDKSVAQRKIEWKATREGQRLIELKRWSVSCSKIISSVKNRVFRLIY